MFEDNKISRSCCSTAMTLEIIGDRWTLLIIRDFIFMGKREYSEFLKLMEGISTNILADRLKWLVSNEIFTKHKHPTNKKKFYYQITERGFDLIKIIMELASWGWDHVPGAESPDQIKKHYKKDRSGFLLYWKNIVKARTDEYL